MRIYQRFLPFGIAIGSTAIALLLSLWLKSLLSALFSQLFYISIILSAWYGGLEAGMVAVSLSTLAIAYFLIGPFAQGLPYLITEDFLQLGTFLVIALIINLLTSKFRESKKEVERLSQKLRQENAEQLKTELNERTRTEFALRESQIQLQRQLTEIETIYQSAPIGLSVLDTELRFARINHRLAEINGFPIEAHIGRTVYEILPNLADSTEHLLRNVLETGEPLLKIEIWGETPSQPGVQRVWLESFLPLKEGDQVIGINIVCEEITERKQAENNLRESQQFLQTVLNSFPQAVFWKNRESVFLGCNQLLAQLLKLESTLEIAGKTDFDFSFTEAEVFHFQLDDESVMTSGIAKIGIEETISLETGEQKWIETNKIPLRDFADNIIGIVGTFQDISDRKRAEAEIKEFNRRWRSVLDSIQMIVIELNQDAIVEYINPFFEIIAQFTPQEVIGKHWMTHFIPPYLSSNVDIVFHKILDEKVPEYYINPILTKSGEERMIAWRNSVLQDNGGQTIGIIAIGEDITEQYRLERIKSEFLSIVSHELKTPLTTIQASLSLLYEKIIDPTSEAGEATIEMATNGIDRLVRLVNDILDLERLRSGKLRLKKNYYDTQQVIKDATSQIQELAKQTETEISVKLSSFSVYADQDRLVQVLLNLLSNAIKFSPHHSKVTLSVEKLMLDSSDGSPPLLWGLFSVRDYGCGILPQNLDSIFEPFQQVDASDAREKGGMGLGLAICRDIIQRHGGRIWVESVLGKGSTFYFTIPTQPLENLPDHN